ncbi:LOB domain-containing protein 24 [Camellia lanceoleosa]|uniref:LOB domain-containing protein 24 n=1 Tax=Camellia lanceoleosa TaxID=1840588 RepID=A0ACC0H201_9ERIC|nr:LOB domain-containing protein 24 [Camellia lanceoleosa]
MSNSTRCAACKSLRRRCSQDCVLAPYFQANNPERFSCVHKIYGASNVTKLLEQLPVDLRANAVDSMVFEASSRIQDPVYGCTQIIFQLRQQIIQTQYEIAQIQAQIAFNNVQQQMHHQQHYHHGNQYQNQHHSGGGGGGGAEPSSQTWMNASEQAEEQHSHLGFTSDFNFTS